jgi:RNA 2',3'-cyclic 3'-phosphodiesterase
MKKTFRTFVAVEIDPAIRARTRGLIDILQRTAADVKWVATENLHLTLQFLGEVPERQIAKVCEAVQKTTAEFAAFELELCGLGAFPNIAHPRTLWIGTGEGRPQMIAMHDRIDTALAALGYRPEDREFQTHLTIGRVRGMMGAAELEKLLLQNESFSAGRMTVSNVRVFCSTLTPQGPIYQPLGTAPLKG